MRISVLIFIFSLAFSFVGKAVDLEREARQAIKEFDNSYYQPRVYGLNDFRTNIRIEGLPTILSRRFIFGKLEDIFFEISWKRGHNGSFSDKKKVKVFGLPDGFVEIKSELNTYILGQIDFIAPLLWSDRLKGYDLSMTVDSDKTRTIIARDIKGLKDAYEIVFVFDNEKKSKPKRIIFKRPSGLETVDLKFFKKPWSRGKWVIQEYLVNRIFGPHTFESKSSFYYGNISGFGLLERIEMIKKQILTQPGSTKSQTYERTEKTVMKLSDWRINTGLKNSHFDGS